MDIKNLEGVSTTQIHEAFNLAFSDYFVPLKLSLEQLETKMKADKTRLELSVGAFDQGRLVGYMLHGFDSIDGKKKVYNGGTGVIPANRGSGLTQQMYQFVLPILKQRQIDSVVLEVISQNIQAIKSYERSGFKTTRTLACFRGDLQVELNLPDLKIEPLDSYNWTLLEGFWDIQPSWQNSKNTLDVLQSSNVSRGAYLEGRLVGYAVYNPAGKRLQQLAVDPAFRRQGIGTSLMSHLQTEYDKALTVINVDIHGTGSIEFLRSMGLTLFLEQFEMELNLDLTSV